MSPRGTNVFCLMLKFLKRERNIEYTPKHNGWQRWSVNLDNQKWFRMRIWDMPVIPK